jgi:hypothetical protein
MSTSVPRYVEMSLFKKIRKKEGRWKKRVAHCPKCQAPLAGNVEKCRVCEYPNPHYKPQKSKHHHPIVPTWHCTLCNLTFHQVKKKCPKCGGRKCVVGELRND